MAIYTFSTLTNGQTIPFNPDEDVLYFDDVAINSDEVLMDTTSSSSIFGHGGKVITLNINLYQATTTNIIFANGGQMLIGDNTTITDFDDVANILNGTAHDDWFIGCGGADQMNGGGGDDFFSMVGADGGDGELGNDTIDAGAGNDTLDCDILNGAAGYSVNLATGTTTLGNSTLRVSGIERVLCSNGADTITGSSGNDDLAGKAGNDAILGGAGNDSIDSGTNGSDGSGTIDGGAGTDTLNYSQNRQDYAISLSGGTYTITGLGSTDTVTGVEQLQFGNQSCRLEKLAATTDSNIVGAYFAMFGRAPEPTGFQYWQGQLGTSYATLGSMIDNWLTLDIVKANGYPNGQSTDQFIRAIYLNIFNKEPDDNGYWASFIPSRGQGTVVADMLAAAQGVPAGTSGKAYIDNKISAATLMVNTQYVYDKDMSLTDLTTLLQEVTATSSTITAASDHLVQQLGSTYTVAGLTGVSTFTDTWLL